MSTLWTECEDRSLNSEASFYLWEGGFPRDENGGWGGRYTPLCRINVVLVEEAANMPIRTLQYKHDPGSRAKQRRPRVIGTYGNTSAPLARMREQRRVK